MLKLFLATRDDNFHGVTGVMRPQGKFEVVLSSSLPTVDSHEAIIGLESRLVGR